MVVEKVVKSDSTVSILIKELEEKYSAKYKEDEAKYITKAVKLISEVIASHKVIGNKEFWLDFTKEKDVHLVEPKKQGNGLTMYYMYKHLAEPILREFRPVVRIKNPSFWGSSCHIIYLD